MAPEHITKHPAIPLSADDLEIEKLSPGEIIHIFSKGDAVDLVETIVKGLYLLNYTQNFAAEVDELMKESELPPWLIMAFTEVKRLNKKALQDSERSAFDFLEFFELK